VGRGDPSARSGGERDHSVKLVGIEWESNNQHVKNRRDTSLPNKGKFQEKGYKRPDTDQKRQRKERIVAGRGLVSNVLFWLD